MLFRHSNGKMSISARKIVKQGCQEFPYRTDHRLVVREDPDFVDVQDQNRYACENQMIFYALNGNLLIIKMRLSEIISF